MMSISHDGDRVCRWGAGAECAPFHSRATDEHVRSLIEWAAAPRPLAAAGAALWQQPGAYGCSTPQIDLLVDRALGCPEVIGAQLAGAGLGGCIMVLVHSDGIERVRQVLEEGYYAQQHVEPQVFVCRPSAGSQVLTSLENWL
jgi:hypothetical protein